MSLPYPGDEAALRALDGHCADPNSQVSKRVVARLAAHSLEDKEEFLISRTIDGMGNLVRCALDAPVSADTTGDPAEGSTPALCIAAQRGTTSALKALLAGGANTELADTNGSTALDWAVGRGHLACVRLLLDTGANANAQDLLDCTPLMNAVVGKQVECARALLPATDLCHTNSDGRTALHATVMTASEACFELLLPMYDVDVRTVPGVDPMTGQAAPAFNMTPLHIACEKGLLPMCKALLSRGADRMARDSRQMIPLHCAVHRGGAICRASSCWLGGLAKSACRPPRSTPLMWTDGLRFTGLLNAARTKFAAHSSGRAPGWTR